MNRNADPMLYVHIPFCVRKCHYCDFLSFPCNHPGGSEEISSYLAALNKEILLTGRESNGGVLSSVFVGGGTPSLLKPEQFETLGEAIREAFILEKRTEWTLEANPGTITREKAAAWKKAGVNRISMGVQSFDDDLLQTLGRIHRRDAVLESYEILREAGFENVSMDLMFGLPDQTMDTWKQTLEEAASLKPEHLSCYGLIIEEGTPFYERQKELALPEEETEREMYHYAIRFLKDRGYAQYEISNFALPGGESRHNTGYWQRRPYYGVGLGAASLLPGDVRCSNTRSMEKYLQVLGKCEDSCDLLALIRESVTSLSCAEAMEEFMFLGFRMNEGVSEEDFLRSFHIDMKKVYGKVLEKYHKEGLLREREGRWSLTEQGIDVSNVILADFLME
ncbi:MAG: oxygen-independent coproporphyrinogen III oxidase [Lachnospiraceae bacterium]|nr:oxygen-independent coproporphyrinogen III oxidase [Lachnospiraceae bacterium]